jgi:hypothetical protein
MVAEEVFLEFATILILLLNSQNVIFKISYKTIWSRGHNSMRLHGARAEKIYLAPQHWSMSCFRTRI